MDECVASLCGADAIYSYFGVVRSNYLLWSEHLTHSNVNYPRYLQELVLLLQKKNLLFVLSLFT